MCVHVYEILCMYIGEIRVFLVKHNTLKKTVDFK